jgi:hypothetical protein
MVVQNSYPVDETVADDRLLLTLAKLACIVVDDDCCFRHQTFSKEKDEFKS